MTKHTRLPVEELRALLRYDPNTGLLYRASDGARALYTMRPNGYLWGHVRGKLILAHRAAWAITHGEWVDQIDHINRVKTDNMISNLRPVSAIENALNKTIRRAHMPELKGIGYLPSKRRWIARFSGRYLGCFEDAESAAREYDSHAKRAGMTGSFLNFPNE